MFLNNCLRYILIDLKVNPTPTPSFQNFGITRILDLNDQENTIYGILCID